MLVSPKEAERIHRSNLIHQWHKKRPGLKEDLESLLDLSLPEDQRYELLEQLKLKYGQEKFEGRSTLIILTRKNFTVFLGIYDNGLNFLMTTASANNLKVETRATVSDLLGGLAITLFS